MTLIEKFQDPAVLQSLSGGEKLSGALVVMVLGIGTCLVVLAIIMFMVKIMHAVMENSERKKAEKEAPAPQIDGETAAAITGAVSEMEGGKPFRVVSIRQTGEGGAKK